MSTHQSKPSYLPDRYGDDWIEPFMVLARPALVEGCRVLDFGGGAKPTIAPGARPRACAYVGLDISGEELDRAPTGSYDEKVVGTIEKELAGRYSEFNLVVSWQVLEHVESMAEALSGIRNALTNGGLFVGQLSGKWAMFALLNRLSPERMGEFAMERLLGREPDSVFRAHYDRCTKSGLLSLAEPWSEFEVFPRYRGAGYLAFARRVARAYVHYEDWAIRAGRADLATHYLIRAVR